MERPENYERLADDLDERADRLEERNEELDEEIGDVRDDWNRKRVDESVPGAQPFPEDADRDEPGDQVNPEDAERDEHERPEQDAADG